MEKFKTFTMWFTLALIAAGLVAFGFPEGEEPTFCTQDAMQCPDGSYVGRTGPKCEFEVCPTPKTDMDWMTMTNEEVGISFRYPEKFSTVYINAYDWPPQVQITEGPFLCTEVGDEEGRAGRTEARMINGRNFCVTEVIGAAAGSRYTQYTYAFAKDGKVPILTFTVRVPECGNYAETPEMVRCAAERQAFNMDAIMDGIASSFRFE